jgi:hypothetical protein
MTIQGFLKRLEASRERWVLDQASVNRPGRLRCTTNEGRWCCPITSLGGAPFTYNYIRDALTLGLSLDDAERLAVNADGLTDHRMYDPALRAQLEAVTIGRVAKAAA